MIFYTTRLVRFHQKRSFSFGEAYEPSTIRLSVGIEPAEQIISNLEHALSRQLSV